MVRTIVPIVEGFGEVEAVPVLIKRIFQHSPNTLTPKVNPPLRIKLGSFLRDNRYFQNYIGMAAHKAVAENGLVLILLDCDDDCPAHLGPEILRRASTIRPDAKFLVALAHREFESWFVTAIKSFKGKYGISADISAPADISGLRNAKGWLSRVMSEPYEPTIHQAQFCKVMNIEQAKMSHSFNRLCVRLQEHL